MQNLKVEVCLMGSNSINYNIIMRARLTLTQGTRQHNLLLSVTLLNITNNVSPKNILI